MGVQFIDVSDWVHDKWLSYRNSGVGASELGGVTNTSDYECAAKVFDRKIGRGSGHIITPRQRAGQASEPINADWWEYWEKDEDTWLSNLNLGKKVRSCESLKSYATNDKYPNLFASLDRRFWSEKHGCWAALELKDITAEAYKKWENESNPSNILQLAAQMLVTGYEYGELSYMVSYRTLKVHPMTYKDALKLERVIVGSVKDFWERVSKARILINQIYEAKSNYNMKLAGDLEYQLALLEPQGDTEAHLEYVTQKYKDKKAVVPYKGTDVQLELARKDKKLSEKIKKIEKEQISVRCELVNSMEDKIEIDFGKEGKVSRFGKFSNKIK